MKTIREVDAVLDVTGKILDFFYDRRVELEMKIRPAFEYEADVIRKQKEASERRWTFWQRKRLKLRELVVRRKLENLRRSVNSYLMATRDLRNGLCDNAIEILGEINTNSRSSTEDAERAGQLREELLKAIEPIRQEIQSF